MIPWVMLMLYTGIADILCAQVTISGDVKNESGTPLANASIIISPVGSNKVVAFKMTDGHGNFSIPIQSSLDSLQVKLNLLNHKTETKIIVNKTQELHFIAKVKATMLEEVFVKEAMIFRKGDTIVHDVSQFANKNDRTLADVIKKMPGLEIDEGGQIKYQGKNINQFTVEGKDVMQGAYGIIPNSIPYKDVNKLEVVENNQPLKILKDKVPSENAGINIKLKKDVTWTGTGSLGIGFSPLLWNLKLAPMLFSKKQQAVFSFKSNNTGEDIVSEMANFIPLAGFMGFSQENNTGNFLNYSSISPPSSVAQNRYWYNTSHVATANFLQGLKKEWEIKTNVQYIYHQLELQGASNTTITNLNTDGSLLNTINYTRSSNANDITRKLKAVLTLNRNAKNNFFKNDLTFRMDRNAVNATVLLNGLPAYQHTNANGFSIQNSLSTVIPLSKNGKQLISIQSYINYIHDPEWYRVDTLSGLQFTNAAMQAAQSLKQLKKSRTFNTTNTFSTSFTKKSLTIIPGIRFKYATDDLNTNLALFDGTGNLQQQMPAPWLNQLQFENLNTQASLNINIKKEKFKLNINLPITNNIIDAHDNENGFKRNINRLYAEPSFFSEISLKKFTLSANASKANSFSSYTSIYPGYVFNALDFKGYESPIEERKTISAGGRVAYKNLFTNEDANMGYSYNRNASNTMLAMQVADNGQQVITAILKDNTGSSQSTYFNYSKYLKDALTNIGGGYNYTYSQTQNLLNDHLFTNATHSQSVNLKIENSYLSWLVGSYTFNYSHLKRKGNSVNNITNNFNQSGRLAFYIFENGSINFSGDWNQYNIGDKKFNNQFFDASYRHTVGKRKIDLEIKWMNILNTKEYEQVIISNIQTSISSFKLRPSQVLFSVRMNLR